MSGPSYRAIFDRARPVVQELLWGQLGNDETDPVQRAVRANIPLSVQQLRNRSTIIEGLVSLVAGVEYSLATGSVEFLKETLV